MSNQNYRTFSDEILEEQKKAGIPANWRSLPQNQMYAEQAIGLESKVKDRFRQQTLAAMMSQGVKGIDQTEYKATAFSLPEDQPTGPIFGTSDEMIDDFIDTRFQQYKSGRPDLVKWQPFVTHHRTRIGAGIDGLLSGAVTTFEGMTEGTVGGIAGWMTDVRSPAETKEDQQLWEWSQTRRISPDGTMVDPDVFAAETQKLSKEQLDRIEFLKRKQIDRVNASSQWGHIVGGAAARSITSGAFGLGGKYNITNGWEQGVSNLVGDDPANPDPMNERYGRSGSTVMVPAMEMVGKAIGTAPYSVPALLTGEAYAGQALVTVPFYFSGWDEDWNRRWSAYQDQVSEAKKEGVEPPAPPTLEDMRTIAHLGGVYEFGSEFTGDVFQKGFMAGRGLTGWAKGKLTGEVAPISARSAAATVSEIETLLSRNRGWRGVTNKIARAGIAGAIEGPVEEGAPIIAKKVSDEFLFPQGYRTEVFTKDSAEQIAVGFIAGSMWGAGHEQFGSESRKRRRAIKDVQSLVDSGMSVAMITGELSKAQEQKTLESMTPGVAQGKHGESNPEITTNAVVVRGSTMALHHLDDIRVGNRSAMFVDPNDLKETLSPAVRKRMDEVGIGQNPIGMIGGKLVFCAIDEVDFVKQSIANDDSESLTGHSPIWQPGSSIMAGAFVFRNANGHVVDIVKYSDPESADSDMAAMKHRAATTGTTVDAVSGRDLAGVSEEVQSMVDADSEMLGIPTQQKRGASKKQTVRGRLQLRSEILSDAKGSSKTKMEKSGPKKADPSAPFMTSYLTSEEIGGAKNGDVTVDVTLNEVPKSQLSEGERNMVTPHNATILDGYVSFTIKNEDGTTRTIEKPINKDGAYLQQSSPDGLYLIREDGNAMTARNALAIGVHEINHRIGLNTRAGANFQGKLANIDPVYALMQAARYMSRADPQTREHVAMGNLASEAEVIKYYEAIWTAANDTLNNESASPEDKAKAQENLNRVRTFAQEAVPNTSNAATGTTMASAHGWMLGQKYSDAQQNSWKKFSGWLSYVMNNHGYSGPEGKQAIYTLSQIINGASENELKIHDDFKTNVEKRFADAMRVYQKEMRESASRGQSDAAAAKQLQAQQSQPADAQQAAPAEPKPGEPGYVGPWVPATQGPAQPSVSQPVPFSTQGQQQPPQQSSASMRDMSNQKAYGSALASGDDRIRQLSGDLANVASLPPEQRASVAADVITKVAGMIPDLIAMLANTQATVIPSTTRTQSQTRTGERPWMAPENVNAGTASDVAKLTDAAEKEQSGNQFQMDESQRNLIEQQRTKPIAFSQQDLKDQPEMMASLRPIPKERWTDRMKNWARNTKLVDAAGALLPMFHGTPASFDEFRPSGTGKLGPGIYLTQMPETSAQYSGVTDDDLNRIDRIKELEVRDQSSLSASEQDELRRNKSAMSSSFVSALRETETPLIMPVVARIEKPIEWDPTNDAPPSIVALFDAAKKFAPEKKLNARAGVTSERAKADFVKSVIFADRSNAFLKQQGYDGIIWQTDQGIEEAVAFDPDQVKGYFNRNPTESPKVMNSIRDSGETDKESGLKQMLQRVGGITTLTADDPRFDPSKADSRGTGVPTQDYRQRNMAEISGSGPLFHQTTVSNAASMLNRMQGAFRQHAPIYVANAPELAMGQSGSGVTIEFDPERVNGSRDRSKPSDRFVSDQGKGEFMLNSSIKNPATAIVARSARDVSRLRANPIMAKLFDLENPQAVENGTRFVARNRVNASVPVEQSQGIEQEPPEAMASSMSRPMTPQDIAGDLAAQDAARNSMGIPAQSEGVETEPPEAMYSNRASRQQQAVSDVRTKTNAPALTKEQQEDLKWKDNEPPTDKSGKYLGAPEWVKSRGDLNRMRADLRKFLNEGLVGRFWYEKSAQAVMKFVGNDLVKAEKFIQLLAIYSPNSNVWVNTIQAVRAYTHWATGKPASSFKVGSGVGDGKAIDVLYHNKNWEGRKTNSFYLNLMSDLVLSYPAEAKTLNLDTDLFTSLNKPATIDVWMARAFGYLNEQFGNDKGTGRYSFAENEVRRLTAQLNSKLNPGEERWTPHQVQAAIWTAMKTRYEIQHVKDATNAKSRADGLLHEKMVEKIDPATGKKKMVREIQYGKTTEENRKHLQNWRSFAVKPGSSEVIASASEMARDFGDDLGRMTQHISFNPIPDASSGHPLSNADANVVREFVAAAKAIVIDPVTGLDALAEKLGISMTRSSISGSGIGSKAGTSVVSSIIPARERGAPGFNNKAATKYAEIMQYIFMKDVMPWVRAENVPLTSKAAEDEMKWKVGSGTGSSFRASRSFDSLEQAIAYADQKAGRVVQGGRYSRGVAYTFKNSIDEQTMKAMVEAVGSVDKNIGLVQMDDKTLVSVNHRDENQVPYFMTDGFFDKMHDFVAGKVYSKLGLSSIEQIWTESNHGKTIDWANEKTPKSANGQRGEARLSQMGISGRSDLSNWVRNRRDAYQSLLDSYDQSHIDQRAAELSKQVSKNDTTALPAQEKAESEFSSRETPPDGESTVAMFSMRRGLGGMADEFTLRVVDKYDTLLRHANNQAPRFAGGVLPETHNPYSRARLLSGVLGAKQQHAQRVYANILRSMAVAGIDQAEMDEFLLAQHAEERNRVIAARNPGNPAMADGGSGMTNQDARDIVADAHMSGRFNELNRHANMWRAMLRTALQERVNAGLITQEHHDFLQAQWQNYVPLRGRPAEPFDEDFENYGETGGYGLSTAGRGMPNALGRNDMAQGITSQVGFVHEDTFRRIERNKVGQAFLRLVNLVNDVGMAQVIRPRKDVLTHGVRRNIHDASWMTEPRNFGLYVDEPVTINGHDYMPGDLVVIQINDRRLAEAMKASGSDIGVLRRALMHMNNWWRFVTTGMGNPAFAPVNQVKDLGAGLINNAAQHGIRDTLQMASRYPRAFLRVMRDEWLGNQPTGSYADFVEAGGDQISFARNDLDTKRTDFDALYAQVENRDPNVRTLARTFLGWYPAYFRASEVATRLAHYEQRVIQGGGGFNLPAQAGVREAAALSARDITIDFAKGGLMKRDMNNLYMFSNASIQGTAMAYRACAASPGMALSLVTMGFIQSAIARAIGGEDKDKHQAYWDNFDDYEKASNIYVFDPRGTGKHVSLPVPYGFNVPISLGSRIADMTFGHATAGQVASGFMTDLLNAANPLGGSGIKSGVGQLGAALVPTMARSVAELGLNRNWADQAIYPKDLSRNPAPASTQYWDNTPEGYVAMAKWMNDHTGGDEFESGAIDMSPNQIQYLATYYFSGAGRILDRLYTAATKDEPVTASDIPIARSFVGDASNKSRSTMSQYYRLGEESAADMRRIKAMGSPDATPETIQAATESLDASQVVIGEEVKQIDKELKTIRKAMKNMTPAQRAALQQVRLGLMNRAIAQKNDLLFPKRKQ